MEKDEIEKMTEIDARSKSNTKRLDEHETRLCNLEKTYSIMEKMDYRMGNVESNVDKINSKLEEVTNSKGKKWDKLVDYLFYFFIATTLGILCFKLGLK